MSLDHLNRLATAAGYATAVCEDDAFGSLPVAESAADFVPLTRSHWPDAPAPRREKSSTMLALIAPPVAPLWGSRPMVAPAAWSATATWAMGRVTSLVTGRSVPA